MKKSRKLDCNQEVKRLQQQLGRKLRLHAEAELQHRLLLETDKVLCDLLKHQEFFEQMFAALTGETCEEQSEAGCVLRQQLRGTLQRVGAAPADAADADAADADEITRAGRIPAMGNQLHEQHQHQMLLPDSYVARLLRQATEQQVQRALQMTTQDWVQFWSDLFPQLVVQLEVCSRVEYDYDAAGMAVAASVGSSTPRPGSTLMQGSTGSMHSQTANNSAAPTPSAAAAASAAGASDVCSGGSGSGQWCWQQQPLGTSPAMDRKLLAQTMDSAVLLVQLGTVLNPVPFLEAAAVCLTSQPQGQPGLQHWEAVVDRLQLTETQQLHISICMAEVKRSNLDMRAESNRLLQCTEQPTLQCAAALQQQQQQMEQLGQQPQQQEDQLSPVSPRSSKRRSGRAGRLPNKHTSSTATAQGTPLMHAGPPPADDQELSDSWQECLGLRLQQLMRKRQVQQLCVQSLFFNTLTTHQLSVVVVASFPFVPAVFTVADIISTRLQQCQQQQLRQLELSPCQKRKGAAAAAAVAACVGGQGLATHKPSAAANSAAVAAAAAAGQSTQDAPVPYSQWLRDQHGQMRDGELLLHQRACWSQLERLLEELQGSKHC